MNLVIRRATADDIDGMYRLSCSVHQATYSRLVPSECRNDFLAAFTYSPENYKRRTDRYAHDINSPAGYAWVAECDGVLAGFIRGSRQDEHTIVGHGLFVAFRYQGVGVGEALFRRALTQAKKGDTMQLFVIENNERAKNLYRKYGFETQGLADKTFYGAKMTVMSKRIG